MKYFDVFYLNPSYRISDSSTTGSSTADASIVISGPNLAWRLVNNRGRFQIALAPNNLISRENWFWLSVVRQYLDGDEDTALDAAGILWLRDNLGRIEELFADEAAAVRSLDELRGLEDAIAERLFGPS